MPERPADESVERMEFLLALRRAASSTRRCCAPWTRCRASISSIRRCADAAYADQALPIACGQTISQPYVVAYMTEQLAVGPSHRVLEVGTGSGYQAAVLSRLAREVVSVERYRTLADVARGRLTTLGYRNVDVVLGDGLVGLPARAPFDRIIVTAAAEEIPQALTAQLAEGGIMVLPLGPHGGPQELVKLTKNRGGDRPSEPDRGALRAAFARPRPGTVRIAKLRGKQRVFVRVERPFQT